MLFLDYGKFTIGSGKPATKWNTTLTSPFYFRISTNKYSRKLLRASRKYNTTTPPSRPKQSIKLPIACKQNSNNLGSGMWPPCVFVPKLDHVDHESAYTFGNAKGSNDDSDSDIVHPLAILHNPLSLPSSHPTGNALYILLCYFRHKHCSSNQILISYNITI